MHLNNNEKPSGARPQFELFIKQRCHTKFWAAHSGFQRDRRVKLHRFQHTHKHTKSSHTWNWRLNPVSLLAFCTRRRKKKKAVIWKCGTVSGGRKVQRQQISNGARSQTAVKTTAGDYGREALHRDTEGGRGGRVPPPMTLTRL